jgi:hypothetical protein
MPKSRAESRVDGIDLAGVDLLPAKRAGIQKNGLDQIGVFQASQELMQGILSYGDPLGLQIVVKAVDRKTCGGIC